MGLLERRDIKGWRSMGKSSGVMARSGEGVWGGRGTLPPLGRGTLPPHLAEASLSVATRVSKIGKVAVSVQARPATESWAAFLVCICKVLEFIEAQGLR